IAGSADDPYISERLRRLSCQDCHGCVLREVKIAQAGNGFRTDQGDVPGEHENVVISGNAVPCTHDGMPGAALLGLRDELDPCLPYCRAHLFCLVADDYVDVL